MYYQKTDARKTEHRRVLSITTTLKSAVKSTLRREFDVSLPLDALKERGDLVAKFAYANWGRQEGAARSMAENAVQMVQRLPSPPRRQERRRHPIWRWMRWRWPSPTRT